MSYGISEISRQTHLELEHKCLNALVGQVKVSLTQRPKLSYND